MTEAEPKVYIGDTETTAHFDDQEKPDVIELALAQIGQGMALGEIEVKRFKPSQPMTYGALAVHHIIPEELENEEPSSQAKLPNDCYYFVGHNIDHDWKALGAPSHVKRICTLAMARTFWHSTPGHSLGACIYRIRDHANAREMLRYAHSAAADLRMTFELFEYLIKGFQELNKVKYSSWGQIWQLSEDCRLPKKWAFGKHKGKLLGQELGEGRPDWGYHTWCLKQPDFDAYVHKAILRYRESAIKS